MATGAAPRPAPAPAPTHGPTPARAPGRPPTPGRQRALGAAAWLASAGLLAGCTPAPGGPGASAATASSVTTVSPSRGATPTVLTGAKAVAKQTLPATVDEWRLSRRTQAAAGSTAYVYGRPADASARLVATLTAVPLTSEALAVALPQQRAIGPAACGTLAGATASACYVPLRGGSLMVTGTPDADTLAALAARLFDTLS